MYTYRHIYIYSFRERYIQNVYMYTYKHIYMFYIERDR